MHDSIRCNANQNPNFNCLSLKISNVHDSMILMISTPRRRCNNDSKSDDCSIPGGQKLNLFFHIEQEFLCEATFDNFIVRESDERKSS